MISHKYLARLVEWVDTFTTSDPLVNNVLCGWVINLPIPHVDRKYSRLVTTDLGLLVLTLMACRSLGASFVFCDIVLTKGDNPVDQPNCNNADGNA